MLDVEVQIVLLDVEVLIILLDVEVQIALLDVEVLIILLDVEIQQFTSLLVELSIKEEEDSIGKWQIAQVLVTKTRNTGIQDNSFQYSSEAGF